VKELITTFIHIMDEKKINCNLLEIVRCGNVSEIYLSLHASVTKGII
jgi:hypothetical protein